MHIEFAERVNADGSFEITIQKGLEGLRKEIAGKYPLPKKLILTKEQKKENMDGLMDLLTGAFCLQEIPNVSFIVRDENGKTLDEYYNSIYNDLRQS